MTAKKFMKRQLPGPARSLLGRAGKPVMLITLSVFCAGTALAQGLGRVEETTSNIPSYFYYVLPGAPTVQVDVLGTVRAPGLYELTEGTDVGQLLALSGGPVLMVRQRASSREVTIKLFRPAANGGAPIYEAVFEQAVGDPETSPVLRDGDVLTVEVTERARFTWRDISSIVGTIGVLALALERLL